MKNLNPIQEFTHLMIEKPKMKFYEKLGEWYIVNRFTYFITKFLSLNVISIYIIKKTHSFLNTFIVLRNTLKNFSNSLQYLAEEKNNKEIDGYSNESKFGYSGDVFYNELMAMYKYKKQIDSNFPEPSESKALYNHIIEKSSILIEAIKPTCYLNFGVSYAYTDSILASKYKNVQFIGIERTSSAKLFNDFYFSNIENLTMIYGDIFETLKNGNFKGGIFMHSRTLLLLPQIFIRNLYKAVYEAGFTHIIGTEQYGISRQLKKAYQFSYNYQDSVVYRDFMYIHNYPNILADTNFKLKRIENIETEHPHNDYRFLSFEAERIN
jgi:hypothetical protein